MALHTHIPSEECARTFRCVSNGQPSAVKPFLIHSGTAQINYYMKQLIAQSSLKAILHRTRKLWQRKSINIGIFGG